MRSLGGVKGFTRAFGQTLSEETGGFSWSKTGKANPTNFVYKYWKLECVAMVLRSAKRVASKFSESVSTIQMSLALLEQTQKRKLFALGALRVIVNILDLVGLGLIGIAGALATEADVDFLPLIESIPPVDAVIFTILGAAAILTLRTALTIWLTKVTVDFLAKIEVDFAHRITKSLISGPIQRFKSFSEAEIQWAVLRSSSIAFSNLLGEVISLLSELSLAIMILAFLLWNDWSGTLVLLSFFLLLLGTLQYFTQNLLAKAGEDFSRGSMAVTNKLLDIASALKEIRVLGISDHFATEVMEERRSVAKSQAVARFLSSLPRLILELGLVVGAVSYLAFSLYQNEGELDLGNFAVLTFGSLRTISALLPLHRATMSIVYEAPMAASAHQMLTKFQTPAQPFDPSRVEEDIAPRQPTRVRDISEFGVEVVLNSVSFWHEDDASAVLRDFSLRIPAGQVIALVGPSGAGKTTLLDCALGVLTPSEGSVTHAGVSPETLRREYSGYVGYVPQKPGMISGSIAENIAIGVPPEEIDELMLARALQLSMLTDLVNSLPDGVETLLGSQKDSFSGGELQRLGLARALYRSPKLIGLDEATSSLDAQTESEISRVIQGLKGQTTTIVIAHRISSIRRADYIHFMDSGEIVASGTYQELRASHAGFKNFIQILGME